MDIWRPKLWGLRVARRAALPVSHKEILDASRIPTSPSRNESQGSGGYEGSGGACRRTEGGVSRHIPQEGEDVGGAVVVGVGGGF